MERGDKVVSGGEEEQAEARKVSVVEEEYKQGEERCKVRGEGWVRRCRKRVKKGV